MHDMWYNGLKDINSLREMFIRKCCMIFQIVCKPWGEVKINLSFTGDEPEWKTSKNEFSDSECSNLGYVPNAGSFQGCVALCQEKPRCTAFNYEKYSTTCVLRGCPLPIVPPAQNHYSTFDGYWKSSASTGSFTQSRSKNHYEAIQLLHKFMQLSVCLF